MLIIKLLAAAFALLGSPLFVIMAAIALISYHGEGIDLSALIIEMSRLAETPLLLSLPLFIFTGTVLSEGRAPERLLNLSRALLGWLPGGLAVVTLLVCSVFTAFSGATGITIFALGGLLFPAMLKDRYPEQFSLGLITTSGSLGLLFPPSLPLILYGVIAETSIDHLFLAGILPGSLMLVLLAAYSFWQGREKDRDADGGPEKTTPVPGKTPDGNPSFDGKKNSASFSPRSVEIFAALREAFWYLPLPVIVLGGIYGGFFIVGEAAAVTALYVLLIEFAVYRDLGPKQLPALVVRSMALFGGIFMVLAASMASTSFLIDQEVPARLFEFIREHISSKYTFLLLLNLFLLAVGCLLDIFSALVLVVPLIVPIALGYGVDLTHLGIIFLTNLQIGYCTPPVGLDLFLASYRFERPITQLYRATLPFLGILLLTLAIITYLPWLSLFLVGLLG